MGQKKGVASCKFIFFYWPWLVFLFLCVCSVPYLLHFFLFSLWLASRSWKGKAVVILCNCNCSTVWLNNFYFLKFQSMRRRKAFPHLCEELAMAMTIKRKLLPWIFFWSFPSSLEKPGHGSSHSSSARNRTITFFPPPSPPSCGLTSWPSLILTRGDGGMENSHLLLFTVVGREQGKQ